jgi:hypothetical protein
MLCTCSLIVIDMIYLFPIALIYLFPIALAMVVILEVCTAEIHFHIKSMWDCVLMQFLHGCTAVHKLVWILHVVFRPQKSKHKSLVAACFEFENRLSDCKDLLANLNYKGAGQQEVDRVFNWQVRYDGFYFDVF